MVTSKQLKVSVDDQDIDVNLSLHRTDDDEYIDYVMISWWAKDEYGYMYYSKCYEFDSYVEANRFLIDYSSISALDLVKMTMAPV